MTDWYFVGTSAFGALVSVVGSVGLIEQGAWSLSVLTVIAFVLFVGAGFNEVVRDE